MPANTIFEFVLYITSEFIALEIYREHYPVRHLSEFTQITWSVIWGVVIYAIVVSVDTEFLSNNLNSRASIFPNFKLLSALFIAGYIGGKFGVLLQSSLFKLSIFSPLKKIAPKHRSIWTLVNNPTTTDWAIVFLADNSIYMGGIKYFTFDPNSESQEFLLTRARRVDENLNEIYLVDGIGVYLNTKDVKRIEFVKGY